jgi:hypothetical protein
MPIEAVGYILHRRNWAVCEGDLLMVRIDGGEEFCHQVYRKPKKEKQ